MDNRPLYYYWLVLYRRKKLIGTLCLSAILVAVLLSLLLPKIYEARTVFFVPSVPQQVLVTTEQPTTGLSQVPLFPTPDDDIAALHIGILKSRTVAQDVTREFPQKSPAELKRDVDIVMNSQYFLEVYVRDRDPELAARVANAYPRYFNDVQRSMALTRFKETRRALEAENQETTDELATLFTKKSELQDKHSVVSMDLAKAKLADQLGSLQNQLSEAFVSSREVNQKIKGIEEQLASEAKAFVPSDLIATNSTVDLLRSKLAELEIQLAGSRLELTENYPDVANLKAQYDATKKSLEAEIDRILQSHTKPADSFSESLRRDLGRAYIDRQVLLARNTALADAIAKVEERLAEISTLEQQFADLDAKTSREQEMQQTLSRKLGEIDTQGRLQSPIVSVVDEAVPPTTPAFPILWLNILVGGVAGLMAGVIYALFVEYIEDVRRGLRIGDKVGDSGV